MHTYTIKPNELQSIALAMSNKSIRYYLCGVFFEKYKDGAISMAATDGHRMHTLNHKAADDVVDSFILRDKTIDKIRAMMRLAKKRTRIWADKAIITITHNNRNLTVQIGLPATDNCEAKLDHFANFTSTAIDGTFPDYRRLLVQSDIYENTDLTKLDASFLADFGKANALLSDSRSNAVIIAPNAAGQGAIRVTLDGHPSFIGLLMPMRINGKKEY